MSTTMDMSKVYTAQLASIYCTVLEASLCFRKCGQLDSIGPKSRGSQALLRADDWGRLFKPTHILAGPIKGMVAGLLISPKVWL